MSLKATKEFYLKKLSKSRMKEFIPELVGQNAMGKNAISIMIGQL